MRNEGVTPDQLMLDARRLWPGETAGEGPLAFVRLADYIPLPAMLALPPWPVIGIGDAAHPLAPHLDAVIEPPFGADAIVRQVLANPHAAAIVVSLLRLLPALDPAPGLAAESMAYGLLQGSAEHHRWLDGRRLVPAAEEGQVQVVREGDALEVTLDRPVSGNAIDRAMRDALHDALNLAALDEDIARVVLRGAGRAFSLGAELGEFGTTTDPATAYAIRALTLPAHAAWRCAGKLEAVVHGACVGAGLELAAWAARITAYRGAWFQVPELPMGVLPGAGGCVSLTRRIGRQRAALMILSGKRLNARQALALGLVDAVVDDPA